VHGLERASRARVPKRQREKIAWERILRAACRGDFAEDQRRASEPSDEMVRARSIGSIQVTPFMHENDTLSE